MNVEVHRRVLHLVVSIHDAYLVEGIGKSALLPRKEESLTHLRVVSDMLPDELMHRKIQHVVTNCKVGARDVDLEAWGVVHNDDLCTEERSQVTLDGFITFVGLESLHHMCATSLLKCGSELGALGFSGIILFLKLCDIVLGQVVLLVLCLETLASSVLVTSDWEPEGRWS